MATTLNLRKLLHRKQLEMCNACSVNSSAGAFYRFLEIPAYNIKHGFAVTGINQQWLYSADEDAWLLLAGSASGGAFAAGACGFISPIGQTGNATAGTTTTLTTNLTINHRLDGYKIRINAGPAGAGKELTIISNTLGSNSVITVEAQSAAFTTATSYTLITPRLWYFCPGTSAVGFNVYDWATNTWTTRSVTNLPTSFGTDGKLVGTPGIKYSPFESSTRAAYSACTTALLTVTGVNWTTNQWANAQIRVTGGTGAGQVRTIASNTATTITPSAAFTTALDATSVWVIEGNDDTLYLFGNNNVAMYRYSISSNTWATVTPSVARAAAPGASMSADWVANVSDSSWKNPDAQLNGRYIYSFRGGNSSALDVYDIALNSWSNISYGNQGEGFTTGTSFEYDDDHIYVMTVSGRVHAFRIVPRRLEPFSFCTYPQGTAVVGDKLFLTTFIDGATKLKFLYQMRNTGAELLRVAVY